MPVGLNAVRYLAAGSETDAELLRRFADRRDEGAFALLVRRHGAMVFGVCRRLLPTDQDAEDAYQATFLVLAQKARSAAPREVGGWLYGVARRAALLARRTITRRRERVGDVPERPAAGSDESRALLDEELCRLPDAYRTVVVLCDLEGRTRGEAAAMLGWPEGTVAGRLVRARRLLAKRLAPAVSVAALLAGTSSARVPEVLAPGAAVPSGVAALSREILGVMARGKLMKTAAVVVLLACAGFGMVLRGGQEKADVPDNPAPAAGGVQPVEKPGAPVRPDPDAAFAWGAELNGLQAGIAFGDAKAFRTGEKVTPTVRVRNVGKTPVGYSSFYARFHFATPLVKDAAGRRVAVIDPRHFFSFPASKDDTLKAGGSVDFGGAALALAPPGDGDVHTVRVEPGTYTLGYSNFLKSHPTLTTGAATFEVKAGAAPPATAWGKEVGGLQAGLAFKDGKTSYRHGETATVVLRVRNVSKEPVEFPHIWAFFVESPPTVTAPDGKTVPPLRLAAEGRQRPRTTTVAPGKEADLHEWKFDLRPKGEGNPVNHTIPGTGRFTIQSERVVGPTSGNPTHPNPAMAKLATGKLELDVTAQSSLAVPEARPRFTVHLSKSAPWPGRSHCAFLDNDRILVHGGPGNGDATLLHRGLQVRDAKDGKLLKHVTVQGQLLGDFRLSADRKWVAAMTVADTTGTFTIPSPGVTVWDTATWAVRGTLDGHALLDAASDGRTVLVREDDGWGAQDGKVEVWDVVARKRLRASPFEFKRIDAGALSPDGSLAVVSGFSEVVYWKWRDGDAHDRIPVGRTVNALAVSPDGKRVAEGPGPRTTVEVRDVATLKVTRTLSDPGQPRVSLLTAGLTFADGGKSLVLGNGIGLVDTIPVPHRILAWDVRTGALTRPIDTKGGAPYSLDVSPDGTTLAATTADDGVSLRTWELGRADGPAGGP